MLARVLCLALSVLALSFSGAQAQLGTQGGCPSNELQESCALAVMSAAADSSSSTPNSVLNVGFIYCAPAATLFGQGPIRDLNSGSLTITSGGSPQTVSTYNVQIFGGSNNPMVTTGTPVNGLAPILDFSNVIITVIGTAGSPTPGQTFTATVTANQIGGVPAVSTAGVTVPLSVIPVAQRNLQFVSQSSCTTIRGDPLFSGFLGQQFYVEGKDGQVFNMLSTHNMQLNGRFVMLEEGAAIYPYQQEALRLESVIAHQSAPSVAAFPQTTAWSHPGNYFGEIGVALMDDNRIHAKAGSFATGFAKATLNGRPLPVSDEFIVLGQGVNTTFIQRVSAHELMVRTVNVEYTITNSDNFLNVENIHLERGFAKNNKFAGMLGHTTSMKWSWDPKEAEEAVVESNNLFELTTVQA